MSMDLEREKMEALEAGQRALSSLNLALKDLNGAKTWGVIDMFGGGFITNIIKQNKMGKANAHMRQAQEDLMILARELNDINVNFDLSIDISEFLDLADLWFDNFFVDWQVQEKIAQAADRVEAAIELVKSLMIQVEMQ